MRAVALGMAILIIGAFAFAGCNDSDSQTAGVSREAKVSPKAKGRFSAGATVTGGPDIQVSPDPIPNAAQSITISGTGFPSGVIGVAVAGGLIVETTADASGSFSVEYDQPGDYGLWKDESFGPELMIVAYGDNTGLITEIFTVEF